MRAPTLALALAPSLIPAPAPTKAYPSRKQFRGNLRHVLALEPCDIKFVRRRLAAAVTAREGRRTIGRAAADFAHIHQARARIRHADNDETVMQQRGMERRDRRF